MWTTKQAKTYLQTRHKYMFVLAYKHFIWIHLYTIIVFHFAATQRGISHSAISVQFWCQFWKLVYFQAHFDRTTLPLRPECKSLSAATVEIKMRRKWKCLFWGGQFSILPSHVGRWLFLSGEHTTLSICKYNTQNKTEAAHFRSITSISSIILNFYNKI